jgi:recombination protein RecA
MSLALLRQQLSEVIESVKPGTPGLPTGIGPLDAALPGGGLPIGRLTELVGPAGSGKTTLVRRMVERAVASNWWVAYIDATRTLAPRDWAHIDARGAANSLWVVRPDNPARGAWCADILLRSGAFRLVVLDGAPILERGIAVRLTRLAREADAAFLVLSDDPKASELAGSLRLRVVKTARRRKSALSTAQHISVVIEKGGPYQQVNIGEVDGGIEVARRVRSHPEVPDRRGVARTQSAGERALGHAADRTRRGEAAAAARGDGGGGATARAHGNDGERSPVAMRRARGARVG